MRLLQRLIYAVVALIGIAAVAIAAVLLTFDPNAYKPDIQDAVRNATGRDLTLTGRIALQISLQPTLHVDEAAFANPPGYSRPQMATLKGLEVQIALLPLLHGELRIVHLIMQQPDILMEVAANGQPNWRMTPAQATPPSAPTPAAQPAAEGRGGWKITSVDVEAVTIEDGKLTWRNVGTGVEQVLTMHRLDAAASGPDTPIHLTVAARYGEMPFNLTADTGSLTQFLNGANAWPAKLNLAIAGGSVAAEGTLDTSAIALDPRLSGRLPDIAALTPLLPQAGQVPLRDVAFSGQVTAGARRGLALSDVKLHAGAGDLGAFVTNLRLVSLDLNAPGPSQLMQVKLSATRGTVPVSVSGTTGAPFGFLRGGRLGAMPVDLAVSAGNGSLTVKGNIADVDALSGVALAVDARIPDLAALSPLAGAALPALKDVTLTGALSDAPGGLANGAGMKGLALRTTQGDLAGDVSFVLAPRLTVEAHLHGDRLDLDALQASLGITDDAAPSGPAAPAGAAHPDPSAPAPHPSAASGSRIFPDTPLPFAILKTADAEIGLDVAVLRTSGSETKSVSFHLALHDGKLAVDRFTADLPAGRMTGSLTADATQAAPPVKLQMHAPGLALSTLLGWIGQRRLASGNIEVFADLSGAGVSPHAIAASLNGSLGLAVAGGTFDNRALGAVLGRVLQAVNVLDLFSKGGNSELRCFAARTEVHDGTATIDPLLLSSSLLTMAGSGTANLGNETVNLGLRPQVKLLATDMVVPVRVSGPMRQPSVTTEKTAVAEAGVSTVTGALVGQNSALATLGGLLGVNQALGIGGDPCPAALAVARGQAPPSQVTNQPASKPALPNLLNPGAALKSLFR